MFQRKVEKADADQKLKTREIQIARELNLEQIAAERAAQQKDAELQKSVEQKRAEMELERLRATTVTQAKIAKESAQQKADADLYTQTKKADAQQYNSKAEADAVYFRGAKDADAALYKASKDAEAKYAARLRDAEGKEREADANYYAQQKEAQGLAEMAKAYGALGDVLGGPQGLMQFLMLQNGTYEKLANANAKAIQGLAPKITTWQTGSSSEGADSGASIRNLFQSLPPLLSTIQDQTGMQPPSWLAKMPQNGEMSVQEKAAAKQQAMLNGHK